MATTKTAHNVFEVIVSLQSDADGRYALRKEDWACGRVKVSVDLQELQNCIGMAVVASSNHEKTELKIFQRTSDGLGFTSTTFKTDLFVIEREGPGLVI